MDPKEVLSQLKDIHLPPPVSWWPLAPGWYIALLLLSIICYVLGKILYKHWRKIYRKRFAVKQMQRLEKRYLQQPTAKIIAKAAMLLKQVVMVKYPRNRVAGLHGEEWLIFLDTITKTQDYTQGAGKLLIKVPYQKHSKDAEVLFPLLIKTMKRCL
jgi:hypothetical protein